MSQAITDQERVELAQKEYEDYKLKDKVKILKVNGNEQTIGIVSQKINNKSTGEQSYIITDKYTPPTASISERSK
ncbi:hypothetical protein U2179_15850, partial [Listeria monocytogenes]